VRISQSIVRTECSQGDIIHSDVGGQSLDLIRLKKLNIQSKRSLQFATFLEYFDICFFRKQEHVAYLIKKCIRTCVFLEPFEQLLREHG